LSVVSSQLSVGTKVVVGGGQDGGVAADAGFGGGLLQGGDDGGWEGFGGEARGVEVEGGEVVGVGVVVLGVGGVGLDERWVGDGAAVEEDGVAEGAVVGLVGVEVDVLAGGELGDEDEGSEREALVVDGVFVASHLAGEGACGIDFFDGIFVGVDAVVEEGVVGGDDAGGRGGEGAPVVVVVHVFGTLEGEVFAGDRVKPGDDAVELCGVEDGVVDEDGGGDGRGAERPLDLVPGLGAGRVVEERVGLCPGVELSESALRFGVIVGGDVLVHACGDAVFEVGVGAGCDGFCRVDGTAGAGEVVVRDVHGDGRCGDCGRGDAGG